MRRLAVLLMLIVPLAASSAPPRWAVRMVARARELLGTPYALGGRQAGRALDCQGLVFLAARAVRRCSWRSYSVYPTVTARNGEFGAPVPGLSPVATAALDAGALQAGDVVMLLDGEENPAEPALTSLDGERQWVWHVGLASGDGRWINADPFTGVVQEVPLATYLADHGYAGVYVLRMTAGPNPPTCR